MGTLLRLDTTATVIDPSAKRVTARDRAGLIEEAGSARKHVRRYGGN